MMEPYQLKEDVPVTGIHVKTFPNGIKEAFDKLMHKFGVERDYYGVSWCDENDDVVYYAMARKMDSDNSEADFESLVIKKGEYDSEKIHNWMSKTDCIKDVFHRLMKDSRPGKENPCIEWYKSDDEMLCLVPTQS